MSNLDKRALNDEVEETEKDPLYFSFSATLRIFGDIPNFDEISSTLGIEPTHIHRKGQARPYSNGKNIWKHDMWMYESPVPQDRPLDVHIQKLWSILKPHKNFIFNLKDNATTVDVFCGYCSNSGTAGFEVSPGALEMFLELEIPFGVSVIIA